MTAILMFLAAAFLVAATVTGVIFEERGRWSSGHR